MDGVFELLAAQPFMAIFLVLGLGYVVGRFSLGFFSLGSTAGSLLVPNQIAMPIRIAPAAIRYEGIALSFSSSAKLCA